MIKRIGRWFYRLAHYPMIPTVLKQYKLLLGGGGAGGGAADHTFTGTSNWTCPGGVSSILAKGIGGGGGGQGSGSYGGGGGAYWTATIATVPGLTYRMDQGLGGTGGNWGTVTKITQLASYLGPDTVVFEAVSGAPGTGGGGGAGGPTGSCLPVSGGSGYAGGNGGTSEGGAGATSSGAGANNCVITNGVNPGDGGGSNLMGAGYSGANGSLIIHY